MQPLLEVLNSRCGWDCILSSYDGCSLTIATGSSIHYAAPLVTFSEVLYVSCASQFSHPIFRFASNTERATIGGIVPLSENVYVVAIEAETMGSLGTHVFFIVAESMQLTTAGPNIAFNPDAFGAD
jgi:hypothetical protein